MRKIPNFKNRRGIPSCQIALEFRMEFYRKIAIKFRAAICAGRPKPMGRSPIIKLALPAPAYKALIRAGALAVHHRLDRGVIRQLLAIDLLDLFPQLARGIFVALCA